MTDYIQSPVAIAADSFAIIRSELRAAGYQLEPPLAAVIERIIHSTADFDFAKITQTSPGAVEAGLRALRSGCSVITDVRMVQVGISTARLAALGGNLHCFVADDLTRQRAEAAGVTRSAMGIRLAAEQGLLGNSVIAIGNAPTALYEVIRCIEAGFRPALVIGVPVGFVSTAESKEALQQVTAVPWLVTTGRKGGSTVAVAIVNALLRLAAGGSNLDVD
ncbi:MAG: precorrin-8X methylmutase [Anaerolineae bacterium]|nr:precorrin-8X methylmutase [Anaerolineales bacterium]MCQ3972322.1 precorrin-8X methylmutase [Anaerolineae bacterium]